MASRHIYRKRLATRARVRQWVKVAPKTPYRPVPARIPPIHVCLCPRSHSSSSSPVRHCQAQSHRPLYQVAAVQSKSRGNQIIRKYFVHPSIHPSIPPFAHLTSQRSRGREQQLWHQTRSFYFPRSINNEKKK